MLQQCVTEMTRIYTPIIRHVIDDCDIIVVMWHDDYNEATRIELSGLTGCHLKKFKLDRGLMQTLKACYQHEECCNYAQDGATCAR